MRRVRGLIVVATVVASAFALRSVPTTTTTGCGNGSDYWCKHANDCPAASGGCCSGTCDCPHAVCTDLGTLPATYFGCCNGVWAPWDPADGGWSACPDAQ